MLPVKVEVLGISSMWLFYRKWICGLISLIISVVGAGYSGSICLWASKSIGWSLLWIESDDVSFCFIS